MYISSKFKCQLSFNWHLNLSKVRATQSWFLANQSLLSLINTVCLVKKQQVPML